MQIVISPGKPIAEVARDLGIHDETLGNWVNAWRRNHPEPAFAPVERARVKELEQEKVASGILTLAVFTPGGDRVDVD